ncbi:putative mitochondrial carnitine/acylcarnitine carrier protein [Cadophora sp. MPI-SDFR-AT-0126]|nr:putative mitochondrial carnitine/acylcarnitine carrier protein [Leotiomycetes sp. MPI-SDFR-AT-0126]
MSADFWAGYISGAAGILIGNPLDLIKVRLQASPLRPAHSVSTLPTGTPVPYTPPFTSASSLIRGATAPILGYGALNALLFVTYNRTSSLLNSQNPLGPTAPPSLWTTWIAGAIGGLATWVVSTPTELVKCRAQISNSVATASSWGITREILRREGIRGLYFGGVVTALRDSVGYGFYFWSYEITTRLMEKKLRERGGADGGSDGVGEAGKVLLCGGLAGVVTWASIFPLDVIKTRVQTQQFQQIPRPTAAEGAPLLATESHPVPRKVGAIEIARNAYRTEGVGVFFRGLGVCSLRAFIVNAAQWAVYEWIMNELDPKRKIAMTSNNSSDDVKL